MGRAATVLAVLTMGAGCGTTAASGIVPSVQSWRVPPGVYTSNPTASARPYCEVGGINASARSPGSLRESIDAERRKLGADAAFVLRTWTEVLSVEERKAWGVAGATYIETTSTEFRFAEAVAIRWGECPDSWTEVAPKPPAP